MFRKLFVFNVDNCVFWQGGEYGLLQIYKCNDCICFFYLFGLICLYCVSFEVVLCMVLGKGKVLSYIFNYQLWNSELEVFYVIVIIELVEQEGLCFFSNVVDLDFLQVYIGMFVWVCFLNVEDVWLFLFEKD